MSGEVQALSKKKILLFGVWIIILRYYAVWLHPVSCNDKILLYLGIKKSLRRCVHFHVDMGWIGTVSHDTTTWMDSELHSWSGEHSSACVCISFPRSPANWKGKTHASCWYHRPIGLEWINKEKRRTSLV